MDRTLFPSWVYNLTQPARIISNDAEFWLLPGTGWSYAPFVSRALDSNPNITGSALAAQQQLSGHVLAPPTIANRPWIGDPENPDAPAAPADPEDVPDAPFHL